MKHFFLFSITLYQLFFPLRGNCRFYPTCSKYAKEAIQKYGIIRGSLLAIKRIIRCNRFFSPGIDLVPV